MWLPEAFDSTLSSWARSCPITLQEELDIHLDVYRFCSDSPPLSAAALYCVSVTHLCQSNVIYYLRQLSVIIMSSIYY